MTLISHLKSFLFFITVLFFTDPSFSQPLQPIFHHYTVEDGLPSSEVYHAIQDSKGFMWFATDRGVCRFDGYRFKSYTTEDGLADNTVFGIYEDYKNRLWFRSFSGKLSYFFNDSVYCLPDSVNDKLAKYNTIIQSMFVGQGDTIWLGIKGVERIIRIYPDYQIKPYSLISEGQMNLMKKDTNVLIHVAKKMDNDNYIFGRGIKPDKYFGKRVKKYFHPSFYTHPFFYSSESNKFDTVMSMRSNKRRSKSLTNIFPLGNGAAIYLYYQNAFKINKTGIVSQTYLNNEVLFFYKDFYNQIWTGTSNGVCRVMKNNWNNCDIKYLSGASVSSIIQSREGGYWFSTLNNGVFYSGSIESKSVSFKNEENNIRITSITGNGNDSVWIGCNNGNVFFLKGDTLKKSTDKKKQKSITKMWYAPDATLRMSNKYRTICSGQNNEVWACSGSNLRRITKDTTYLIHVGLQVNSLLFNRNKDTLWMGCINGLYSFVNGEIKSFGNKNPLLKSRINKISITDDGFLYLATSTNGLLIKKGDSVWQIKKRDGLISNICNSLLIDESNIWVATNSGISKIKMIGLNNRKYQIQNYTTSDGLISNEILNVVLQDNKVYAASPVGISVFDKHKRKIDTVPPPVHITGLFVKNKSYPIQRKYKFQHNENYIAINYIGLTYKSMGNLSYKYRVKGLDSAWKHSKNTAVQYPFLKPGNYKFEVKAINRHGYESLVPASIEFVIFPPYYATWWFRGLIILAAILLIGVVFHIRTKQLKRQNFLMQELTRFRHQALSAQMNPHFIFNSLNSIQNYIIKNNNTASQKYLAKFAKLIRITLENSREDQVPLENDIKALEFYLELEQLRFKGKLKYNITVDAEIIKNRLKIPPFLIQPYVENAVWHGIMPKKGDGIVTIAIKNRESMINCIIEDNGVGRYFNQKSEENKTHKSAGMSITESRLKLLNSIYKNKNKLHITDLKDDSGNPRGTKVEFSVPKNVQL